MLQETKSNDDKYLIEIGHIYEQNFSNRYDPQNLFYNNELFILTPSVSVAD